MFATHLHEIETLLLTSPPLPTLHRRCLRVSKADDGAVTMHYVLEEGVCTDSLALHAARVAGLPEGLLSRMQELTDISPAVAPLPPSPSRPAVPPIAAGSVDCAALEDTEAALDGFAEGGEGTLEAALRTVGDLLRETCGSEAYIHVPLEHEPPPRLSGRSCVYVLQRRTSRSRTSADGTAKSGCAEASLYVGESDSISQRLRQHRSRHRSSSIECVVVEVESKTTALVMEALMIKKLKALGIGRVTNVVHA
eukprot:6656854-Prymnesium_polylepis.1